MAEKSGKKKTKKSTKASGDSGVLGNLSATRPTRLGGDRRAAASRTRSAAATSSRPAAASAAKTAAATKPKAAASQPKATTAKATAAKPKATKPKAVKPKVRTLEGTQPTPPRNTPPAGWQAPDQDGRKGAPQGPTEIVTTAVQAAGELAQIGLTVGSQLLKRATRRLPRP